jgi:hypothetical protein
VIGADSPDAFTWRSHGVPQAARQIIAFLEMVGILVKLRKVENSVLPGMTAIAGTIHVDAGIEAWPGDLLHEAGHIAMTAPELRMSVAPISDDPAEEMAAIAWSWAASVHLGLADEVVFHTGGYRGGAMSLAANYRAGATMGVPILAMYGMTAEPHRAAAQGIAAYPVMQRWLR